MSSIQENGATVARIAQHSERAAYRPDELPALLALSQSMVYKMLRAGTIRSVRVGRRFVVPVDAVSEFLTGNRPRAAEAQAQGRTDD